MSRRRLRTGPWLLLVVLAFSAGVYADASPRPGGGGETGKEVWFGDLHDPLPLSAAEMRLLARALHASFASAQADFELPERAEQDRSARIVFVSVGDRTLPARVFMGSGRRFRRALERALARARRFAKRKPAHLRLDIVEEVRALGQVRQDQRLRLKRSLEGLAFDRQSRLAFLPGETMARRLVDGHGRLRPANVAEYLRGRDREWRQFARLRRARQRQLYAFRTRSFFSDGITVAPLYREHRVFDRVSRPELLAAARSGGEYLLRAVRADGRFVYSYSAKSDAASHKYNILRHAGTVYAMLDLYGVTRDPKLLAAARRALGYLVEAVVPCPVAGKVLACVAERGEIKLGGNALAVVALAKYAEVTADRQHVPLAIRLGKWIVQAQNDRGEFHIQRQKRETGEVTDFVSQYYPGEAVLALVRLYGIDPQERWLDAAAKGARYLIEVRDRGVPEAKLIHDHWLLYALNELYRQRPKPEYLEHARRLGRAIVSSQNRSPRYPDWRGSYYHPPRSTPTATRTEGLLAALALARDFGSEKEAAAILAAIRLAVGFQLQTQFRPESVFWLRDPARALGGFHRSLTNFEIRIDYVQHNISSLLGYYRVLG